MKIAIVTPSPIPFLIGGAEKLFMGMLYNLNKYTSNEVELIKIPVKDQDFWELIKGYKKFYHFDLDHFDMVIATKYPAWMIEHENKLIYMQHPCRGVYELYTLYEKGENWRKVIKRHGTLKKLGKLLEEILENESIPKNIAGELIDEVLSLETSGLPKEIWDFPGPITRAIIKALDKIAFQNAKYAAISKTVALREGYFPKGAKVKIIYHPTNLEGLHSKGYEYIFTASRLEGLKRIDLLIKAYKKVKSDLPFLIAGTGGQENYLKELAKDDKRIKFLGFVSDEELKDLYSKALFVPFVPYKEDYGLITIEAMQSGKAVLTVEDAGGPTEIVKHKKTGLIVKPKVEEVAEAMQWLIDNKEETIKMGNLGKESIKQISWENFSKKLLEDSENNTIIPTKSKKAKKKLLVLSTFPTHPLISGGKLRLFNLYKSLTDEFIITIVATGEENSKKRHRENLLEITVKKPLEIFELQKQLEKETGVSSGDLAIAEGWRKFKEFKEIINELKNEVAGVIVYHPYLIEAVEKWELPIFYDAPDIEVEQKRMHYINEKWVKRVYELEKKAVEKSEFIWTPAEEGKDILAELYGVEKDKIITVGNGVDIKKIKMIEEKEKNKLKLRLGIGKRMVAVFAGSYHPPNIKALPTIVETAKKVKNVLFLVIGDVCLGIKEKEIPDNLLLMGVLKEEEKDLLFKISDIGLNPVESGSGTNVKLAEYMAYGLIVVTTAFGKRGYKVGENEGIFVAETNEFPNTIRELTKKKEVFPELRKRTREYAEKELSWEKMGENLKKKLKNYFYKN